MTVITSADHTRALTEALRDLIPVLVTKTFDDQSNCDVYRISTRESWFDQYIKVHPGQYVALKHRAMDILFGRDKRERAVRRGAACEEPRFGRGEHAIGRSLALWALVHDSDDMDAIIHRYYYRLILDVTPGRYLSYEAVKALHHVVHVEHGGVARTVFVDGASSRQYFYHWWPLVQQGQALAEAHVGRGVDTVRIRSVEGYRSIGQWAVACVLYDAALVPGD